MPLGPNNTRVFHRTLYSNELKTIVLLKRGDDQSEGTVTAYKLFECRRSRINKSGEPYQGDMASDHSTRWHIPRTELDRVGVAYINGLDRFVERSDAQQGSPSYGLVRYWAPEDGQAIDIALFENYVHVDCLRIDPPAVNGVVQGPTPGPG